MSRPACRAAALAVAALAALSLPAQGTQPATQPATHAATQSTSQPSLRELAIGAERRGRHAEAAEFYLRLVDAEPANHEWVVGAGRTLGMAGRYNDALDLLDRGLQRFPDAVEVRAMLARVYVLKAESMVARGVRDANVTYAYGDAARVAAEVLERHPAHRDARLILAQARYSLGELDEAERAARECVARFPDHPGGHVLLGNVAFDRFVALRRTLAEERPTGQRQADLIQEAATLRDAAARAYEAALRADPVRVFPLVKLGDLEAWQGRLEAALSFYRRALVADPEVAVNHGWIRQNVQPGRRAEFYSEAAAAYRKGQDAQPAKAALLDWYHAEAHFAAAAWKPAKELFAQAVAANPRYLNSLYYVMLAAYWDGDMAAAEESAAYYAEQAPIEFSDLVQSLEKAEQALGVIQFLADRCFQAGKLPRSRDLNRVLALAVKSADRWNNYAFLCRETGRYQESYEAYEAALAAEPDSPQILNDAAVILQYHLATPENLARAKAMYQRAIERAAAILADPKATPPAKARARQAAQDARGNLKRL